MHGWFVMKMNTVALSSDMPHTSTCTSAVIDATNVTSLLLGAGR